MPRRDWGDITGKVPAWSAQWRPHFSSLGLMEHNDPLSTHYHSFLATNARTEGVYTKEETFTSIPSVTQSRARHSQLPGEKLTSESPGNLKGHKES